MYKGIVVTLAALAVGLASSLSHAAGFSSLEERMSQNEFRAAGLEKLSPEELKSLNEWLRTHNAVVTTVITTTPSGEPLFYPRDSDRTTIQSHIDGKFSGWHGKTTVRLENGQEWTQTESGGVACGNSDNAAIKIKPMALGSWLAYVSSCSDSVRVTRSK